MKVQRSAFNVLIVVVVAAAAVVTLAGCSWNFKSDNLNVKFSKERSNPGAWKRIPRTVTHG